MLWTLVLAILLYGLRNYKPFRGFPIALIFLLYSSVRFYLDSLRVGDRLYWGLTPGQYFSMIVFGIGLYLLVRGIRTRNAGRRTQKKSKS